MNAQFASDLPGMARFAHNLRQLTRPLFDVKLGHLNESVARALGFKSYATALTSGAAHLYEPMFFDYAVFAQRLGELTEQPGTAWAAMEIVAGATLSCRIEKHPPAQQHDGETQYGVTLEATSPASAPGTLTVFDLPSFARNGQEPYRVDSAWSHRVDAPDVDVVTRNRSGRGLMTAALRDGAWSGELYVYSQVHQDRDGPCLTAVTAALARCVLPTLSGGVRCRIYGPDQYGYMPGAWRVELELPTDAMQLVSRELVAFALPTRDEAPMRLLTADEGFRYGGSHHGQFVGGRWHGHLYSNGIAESSNPTSIAWVRHLLLSAVYRRLADFGWRYGTSGRVLGYAVDKLI